MQNLLIRLPDAKHYASLGDTDAFLFRMLEDLETLPEGRPAVPHVRCEFLDRFYIVRINIQTGLSHDGDVFKGAAKVSSESFDEYMRCPV
jgi:hypothetical protein